MNTVEKKIEEALATIGNEVGSDTSTRALVGELIMAAADWFKVFAISDEVDVQNAMDALMDLVAPKRKESPVDAWLDLPKRPKWTDKAGMHSWHWHWAGNFRLLREYCDHGQIWPRHDHDDEDYIQKVPLLLGECAEFLTRMPTEWITNPELHAAYHSVCIVFGKARGRYRLDAGDDLDFYEVVLLSGMAPKSVRNATQERHGAGRLIVGDGDIVKNANAVAWLRERRTFNPTPGSNADEPRSSPADPQDFVFIPIDEKGRPFDPELVVQGPPGPAYHYATGDEEQFTEKYMEALAEAQAAQIFQWCLSDGSWTELTSWARVSKSALRRKEKIANDRRRLLCTEYNDYVARVRKEHEESVDSSASAARYESAELQKKWAEDDPDGTESERITPPKAYQSWSEKDSSGLMRDYEMKMSISELALKYSRSPGAIKSKLVHLGKTWEEIGPWANPEV